MIILSISTIPDRLSHILEILNRLKRQTMFPDKIYISIANFYPRLNKTYSQDDLNTLENYIQNYPVKIEILRQDEDIGPCIKLLGPIDYCTNDDVIIICDDDSGLNDRGIELLYNEYLKNKNFRYGFMGIYKNQFLHGENIRHDFGLMNNYFDVQDLGGYRGILYPVFLLDKQELKEWVDMFVQEHKKYNLVAMHDDHIFNYYCKYKNISSRVVKIPNVVDKLFYDPIKTENGIFQDALCTKTFNITTNLIKNKGLGHLL